MTQFEQDLAELKSLASQYKNEAQGYQFLNEQLLRLNSIEKKMKAIFDKYVTDVPNLLTLISEVPYAYKHIGIPDRSEYEKVIEKYKRKQQYENGPRFYSLDGQEFLSLDQAMARNAQLQNGMDTVLPEKTTVER